MYFLDFNVSCTYLYVQNTLWYLASQLIDRCALLTKSVFQSLRDKFPASWAFQKAQIPRCLWPGNLTFVSQVMGDVDGNT